MSRRDPENASNLEALQQLQQKAKANSSETDLHDLPLEMFVVEMGLHTADLAHLASSSRFFHGLLGGELKQRAVTQLLLHVVRGEEKEAQAMIAKNPD